MAIAALIKEGAKTYHADLSCATHMGLEEDVVVSDEELEKQGKRNACKRCWTEMGYVA